MAQWLSTVKRTEHLLPKDLFSPGCGPLIPALRGRDTLSEFEANLMYRAGSRIGSKATQRNPISKKQKQINNNNKRLVLNSSS